MIKEKIEDILVNPIKDNRIVNDYTFSVRFNLFLKWIPQNWVRSQPHYFEEYNYLLYIAESLLKYQIETASNDRELNYLKSLNLYDKK